jgi:hypothetical protein
MKIRQCVANPADNELVIPSTITIKLDASDMSDMNALAGIPIPAEDFQHLASNVIM